MNAGQLQSLKDLIEFLKQQEVGEFDLEQEDLKVHLSFAGHGHSAGNVDLSQLSHFLKQAPTPPPAAVVTPAHLPSVSAGTRSGRFDRRERGCWSAYRQIAYSRDILRSVRARRGALY